MSILTKSPKAATIAIYSLGFLIGALHIFLGAVSISPLISREYHQEVVSLYGGFARNLLSFYKFTTPALAAYYLRIAFSAAQIAFGAALMENGHFGNFGKYGNYGLIGLNFILTLLKLSSGVAYEKLAPTVVYTTLLISRVVLVEQVSRRGKPRSSNRPQRKVSPKKRD